MKISAWGCIGPSGELTVNSAFKDESHVWDIVFGWPSEEEIARAKADGWKVKVFEVID